MTRKHERRMILCAGLQSSGTTLISWCFLQRRDTNGVLDMPHDTLQTSFDKVMEPVVWVKMTISAFRWVDVCDLLADLGWYPEPLLIARDVRSTYASLMTKDYGRNGTTAEDPPLRMRFRRFLQDWEMFRAQGWPILKYEDFIMDERPALREACGALALPWDEAMIVWPKKVQEIAYIDEPNETFRRSLAAGSLPAAKIVDKAKISLGNIPPSELTWLEAAFKVFNEHHGYPVQVPSETRLSSALLSPAFENTRRHEDSQEYERLWREHDALCRSLPQSQASA
jgi:hypothetical protein